MDGSVQIHTRGTRAHLDVAVHGGRLGGTNQSFQLSTTEIFGLCGQLQHVHVESKQLELPHLSRVDVQDLHSAFLIRQA